MLASIADIQREEPWTTDQGPPTTYSVEKLGDLEV